MAKIIVKNFIFANKMCIQSYNRLMYSSCSIKLLVPQQKLESIEPPDYLNKQFTSKKKTINKLKELFNIRTFTALDIATRHKQLSIASNKCIEENYNICLEAKIKESTLLKYPNILAQKDLKSKLELIRELSYDLNVTAVFLCMDLFKLEIFIKRYKKECDILEGGRIALFSKFFEVDEEIICKALFEKTFLQTIDIERVKKNLEILSDFHISKDALNRDYWVLRYNPEIIEQRLNEAKDNNIDNLKTWMVRAKPEIFERYVRRRSDNKLILGNNSLAEYLSDRLECPVDQAKVLMIKHPALKTKSMKKIEEIIDFLYSQGFKPLHICRVPKILLHSVETTKKRLKELKNLDTQFDSLYVLTKSKKQYTQFYELLVKSKKKNKD